MSDTKNPFSDFDMNIIKSLEDTNTVIGFGGSNENSIIN
jgi:hypothetical protein